MHYSVDFRGQAMILKWIGMPLMFLKLTPIHKVLGRVIHKNNIKKLHIKWFIFMFMQGCATSTVPGSMPGVT